MLFPTLIAGGFSLMMASASDAAADQVAKAQHGESAPLVAEQITSSTGVRVAVSRVAYPSAAFPTREMAEQFEVYLAWTKANGLSRLVAFEQLANDQIHYSPNLSAEMPLPTAEMAEQFAAYLRWTREQNLSEFYAFQVSNFD